MNAPEQKIIIHTGDSNVNELGDIQVTGDIGSGIGFVLLVVIIVGVWKRDWIKAKVVAWFKR